MDGGKDTTEIAPLSHQSLQNWAHSARLDSGPAQATRVNESDTQMMVRKAKAVGRLWS